MSLKITNHCTDPTGGVEPQKLPNTCPGVGRECAGALSSGAAGSHSLPSKETAGDEAFVKSEPLKSCPGA